MEFRRCFTGDSLLPYGVGLFLLMPIPVSVYKSLILVFLSGLEKSLLAGTKPQGLDSACVHALAIKYKFSRRMDIVCYSLSLTRLLLFLLWRFRTWIAYYHHIWFHTRGLPYRQHPPVFANQLGYPRILRLMGTRASYPSLISLLLRIGSCPYTAGSVL